MSYDVLRPEDEEIEDEDKQLKKKINELQVPIKKNSILRNIRFLYCIVLFWNLLVNLFLVFLFGYLEISIVRYNQSTLFNILETTFLSMYIVAFYSIKFFVYIWLPKDQRKKIYDRRLIENRKDQFTIDWFLVIPTIIILFSNNAYQIKVGGQNDDFYTVAGIFYTMLCMIRVGMAWMSIFIVITCIFSYYRPYIPPESFKHRTNMPYVADNFFDVTDYENSNGKFYKIQLKENY